MLQIPSSVFSMLPFSSSSQDLVHIFSIAVQVAASLVLSNLKPKVDATRTFKIVVEPTKCVLANAVAPFPYVAAMGFAIIVMTALGSILHAKRFFFPPTPPSDTDVKPENGSFTPNPNPPPTPPPDADTESHARKRRRALWPWILLLVLGTIVLLGLFLAYRYSVPPRPISNPLTSFGGATVVWIEKGLSPVQMSSLLLGIKRPMSSISFIAQYISLQGRIHFSRHWRQYFRFILVVTGHHLSILVGRALRRGCIYVARHPHRYLWVVNWSQSGLVVIILGPASALEKAWINLATNFLIFIPIPVATIAIPFLASSWLRGFLWVVYYYGYRAGILPSLPQMQLGFNWIQRPFLVFSAIDYSMLIGPLFIHLGVLFLLAIYSLPLMVIVRHSLAVLRGISKYGRVRVIALALQATFCALRKLLRAALILVAICSVVQLYHLLDAPSMLLIWDSLSSSNAREALWALVCYRIERYRAWEGVQVYHLSDASRRALNAARGTWAAMTWTQKLLIIVPAIIFYFIVEFVGPAYRKSLEREMREMLHHPWRWRRRRRSLREALG
ncbi:hypothetical protein C8R46DRAFT_1091906 [Mycena filopes]|nr:hypothetical protein C8R46DRAFT_1091906 [Mycena filopes]